MQTYMIGRDIKYREDMNDTGVRISVLTVGVSVFLLLFGGFYNVSAQVIDEQTLEVRAEPDIAPPAQPVVEFVTPQEQFPPVFRLHAEDRESGISHFVVKLEDGRELRVHPGQLVSGDFGLDPAIYLVEVNAFDRAGNRSGSTFNLIVPPAPTPILDPLVRQQIDVGDTLSIEGTAEPNSTIIAYIRDAQGGVTTEHTVELLADENGSFFRTLRPQLAPGSYRIAVQARLSNNQLSSLSQAHLFVVSDTTKVLGLEISPTLIPILIVIGLIGIIGFIIAMVVLLLGMNKRHHLKQTVARELQN